MLQLRVRNRVAEPEVAALAGRVLGPADYDALLTGPARLLKPDGRPLCIYLPRVLQQHTLNPLIYEILHGLRTQTSTNRGLASGTRRVGITGLRTYTVPIASAVAGAVDPMGQQRYCRLTAWTGQHLPQWQALQPLLQAVAGLLREHVPDRYRAQAEQAARTQPEWVVPGTPFTTITVNNSYSTGVHTDKGDLDAGFSTISCLRRGGYTGGQLVFPAYRVAADLHDGDLILMDAHDWHANTAMVCGCGQRMMGMCEECGAERISVVAYYRTRIAECGTAEQEAARAAEWVARRTSRSVDGTGTEVDEDELAGGGAAAIVGAGQVT